MIEGKMEEFYIKIYLFRANRVPPINIARNSQLRITVETMDYTIPAGATASAFSKGAFSGKIYTQSCTVDGNRISFIPEPGFFVPGRNSLQYEIGGGVIPLAIDVNCELSLPDGGEAAEPEQVLSLAHRAEAAANAAAGSAQAAEESKNAAETSASSAAGSAAAAEASENAAADSAASAEAAALAAAGSAQAAEESKKAAEASASSAAGSAAAAGASESASADSAASAEAAALAAAGSAQAALESKNAAEVSANSAAGSATAAAASENAAANSAASAEKDALAAAGSAQAAEESKNAAEVSASSAAGSAEKAIEFLDVTFQQLLNGTNTTSVFWNWWPLSENGVDSKYHRLERFGTMLAKAWAGKTYTLRGYAAEVSGDTALEPLDDLAGLAPAALATDTDNGGEDWAEEDPMTWYIRANALSLDNGHMNILAVEGEDGFDITGEKAPVYRFSLALFKRWTEDESYEIRSYKTVAAPGYDPYERDISPDGTKRILTWAPCFCGGLTADGKLTSGAGKKPYIFASAQQGLDAARKWDGGNDALWNDGDSEWLLDTWQLRHFDKENSNKLEGCLSYNVQKKVALAESGVRRVLLATADAAGLVVGSAVSIGDPGSNTNYDRGQSYMRSIAHLVRISSIENVTIDGTVYAAVNLELDGDIDTTGTTMISTMPWHSGSTEALPGHRDGSIGSLTNGKFPARISGMEVLNGANVIGIDPLYSVTANENGGFDYAVYVCRDSKNLSGSITSNHVDTGIRLTGVASGWNWTKAFALNKLGILIPRLFGGNSSGWYKSAFGGAYSGGVRVPWRWGSLYYGGSGGLACGSAGYSPGYAHWYGSPRLSGSGKKRGELPS